MIDTFGDLIALWPNDAAFASDHGVESARVALWRYRNSVPSRYWDKTIAAAAHRGIPGVDVGLLSHLEREATPRRKSHGAEAAAD